VTIIFSKMGMKNKKGSEILTETTIFVILNIVFFVMLIGFIYLQSSPKALEQQETAKQIALLIDAARPGTEITLDVSETMKRAEGVEKPIVIDNENNLVKVSLSLDSFYEYGFFNDVNVVYSLSLDETTLKIEMGAEA